MTLSESAADDLTTQLEGLHEASFGWALSCCRWDEAYAEDVLQNSYLKVLSGKASFEGRSSFKTWLFGVIRQTAREQYRRVRSHRDRAHRLAIHTDPRSGATDAPDVEGSLARAALARRLREELSELAPKQRQVLHLVFYEDMSVREASEVMDVSIGTARVHYDRGKKRLKARLIGEEESS